MQVKPRTSEQFAKSCWLDLAVIAAALAAMTAWTWRKWPDLLVDFGLQLYLPWKLSTGAVLYRDVAYLPGGPLSQYYHALLFRLFGASFTVLIVSNLLIISSLLYLAYRFFLGVSDRLTATTVCLAIVLVFAFGYYSDFGNYNYITPYCYEAFHGLVLSIVTVTLLSKWLLKKNRVLAFGIGLGCGLTFLTKPEIFLALMLCVIVSLLADGWMTGKTRQIFEGAGIIALAGITPALGFVLYFYQVESFEASLRSAAWAWVQLLSTQAAHNSFYRWCLGFDAPTVHIKKMLWQFGGFLVATGVFAALFRLSTRTSFNRLLLVGAAAGLGMVASDLNWGDCGRVLPLLCLALLGLLLRQVRTAGWNSATIFPATWTLFSLALLAKLGFFCRIWHYGFVLAMPAFVSGVFLTLWILPRWLERYGVRKDFFRGLVCLILVIAAARLMIQSHYLYSQKTVAVGEGGNRLWTFQSKFEPAGAAMGEALRWIEANVPADASLAALPEGAMLNYLSHRTNPTGYTSWNPPEMAAFGQATMTAAFRRNSPDYVVLIHRENWEYGENYFGKEERFGREVMRWICQHYEPVYQIGHEPLQNTQFGIKILRRKSSPQT